MTFHRLYALGDGKRLNVPDADWPSVMRKLAKRDFVDLTDGTYVFEPATMDDGTATLGVHAPLNTAFMSQIDPDTHKASDLLGKDQGAKRFAYSTAVAFLPVGNVFALALGGVHSPKAGQVAAFLDLCWPLDNKAGWKAEPLVDVDRLAEFREHGKGVYSFASRFTTARNLFAQDPGGVLGLADMLASRIEGDVEVELKVKIAGAQARNPVRRLYELVAEDLPRVVGSPYYRTRAETLMDDGTRETLDLVASRFAVEIDVDQATTESQSFTSLMAETVRVGAEMQTRVERLTKG